MIIQLKNRKLQVGGNAVFEILHKNYKENVNDLKYL